MLCSAALAVHASDMRWNDVDDDDGGGGTHIAVYDVREEQPHT